MALAAIRIFSGGGFYLSALIFFSFFGGVSAEEGTSAKTLRNETRRTPKSSPDPAPSVPATPAASGRTNTEDNKGNGTSGGSSVTGSSRVCYECSDEEIQFQDTQRRHEARIRRDGPAAKSLYVNSRVVFTNWNFNFSPAIQYESFFFPTYEMDISLFGLEFSYLTAIPPQPGNLFRDIPLVGQENTAGNALMEFLRLAALPLTFTKNPLLQNLLAVEFRKTTKQTTIIAAQNLYYFPYSTYGGLTPQDSDLGMIYYEQKPAGSRLSYNIKERDWLVTVGLYAFRIGYFDINYAKPYQMDADIYQSGTLIDRRVFLFEGQATGRGIMIGLQNLYFPTWDTRRFYFTTPDTLADGFFWGLKELGFYWGSGSILLQNNIDLVEKYRAFYQSETGRAPSVSFLRQVFHVIVGYKFNETFRVYIEYRYTNYSLALKDRYEDAAYSYFLSHALNRDTVQQLGINLTVAF
ncbi:MAG: hypothetical protein J0L53_05460 [Spirochaetes bacterium]|nr:hypothetical protein [Spirochaetota bacterium]